RSAHGISGPDESKSSSLLPASGAVSAWTTLVQFGGIVTDLAVASATSTIDGAVDDVATAAGDRYAGDSASTKSHQVAWLRLASRHRARPQCAPPVPSPR